LHGGDYVLEVVDWVDVSRRLGLGWVVGGREVGLLVKLGGILVGDDLLESADDLTGFDDVVVQILDHGQDTRLDTLFGGVKLAENLSRIVEVTICSGQYYQVLGQGEQLVHGLLLDVRHVVVKLEDLEVLTVVFQFVEDVATGLNQGPGVEMHTVPHHELRDQFLLQTAQHLHFVLEVRVPLKVSFVYVVKLGLDRHPQVVDQRLHLFQEVL
jgi:hypothetical protein